MTRITDVATLHALYGQPGAASTEKVADWMHPVYRRWIEASRFCVLTTVGPDGTDGSPRGDDGPVVTVLDDKTLAMPDWRGNNRVDSLSNIVRDGRLSLMFMVPGSTTTVRINGTGYLSVDDDLLAKFERKGQRPRSVIVITIGEVYFQCARALLRSALWTSGDESAGLPSAGDFLKEVTEGKEGGAKYDAEWPDRAKATLW